MFKGRSGGASDERFNDGDGRPMIDGEEGQCEGEEKREGTDGEGGRGGRAERRYLGKQG